MRKPAATAVIDPAGEDSTAIAGEVVELTAVEPSAHQVEAARDRAKTRTAAQAFSAGFVVGIAIWFLRLHDIDLNPDPASAEMPNEVVIAWTNALTWLAAVWMNRARR